MIVPGRARAVARGPLRSAAALAALVLVSTPALGPPALEAQTRRPPADRSRAAAAGPRLIPAPRRWQPATGRFPLRGTVTIAVPGGDAEDRFAASLLEEEIEAASDAEAQVSAGPGAITLERDASLADAGDEGYRLEITTSAARVRARTAAGIFYGVQTLRQMVEPAGIAAGVVEDRPALRWRGVHDDVSRGPVPTLDALKRRVRTLAEVKVNLYALYLERAFAYQSHPLAAQPGAAFTAAELRELGEFARRHHVALLLEQQTGSHMERLLALERYQPMAEVPHGTNLSPAAPGYEAMIGDWFAELAPLSTAPWVHGCADEMSEFNTGQSKAFVQSAGGIDGATAKHVRQLRDRLAPHGKRLMIWGDGVLAHPGSLRQLPDDVTVASWSYDVLERYDSFIKPIRDAGREVVVCPGVSNWNRVFPNLDIAVPNIRVFTRDGQRLGATGQLNCSWDDNGDALFGMLWYPLLYGAAAAWQEGDSDPAAFARAFDWVFFRHDGDALAAANRLLGGIHTSLNTVWPTEFNLELLWLHPAFPGIDRRLLSKVEPVAARLRDEAERALEHVERARPGVRRNADQLDHLAFAARRIHSLGGKAEDSVRLPALYQEALASQTPERHNQAREQLARILALLVQGREVSAALRADYERLWLTENRRYGLDMILAQFDRDARLWVDKSEEIRVHTVLFRNGKPLPTLEQIGFAP